MRVTSYGPEFRWFAWHPVDTDDRGWRWLRMVWRRREYNHVPFPGLADFRSWAHRVNKETNR